MLFYSVLHILVCTVWPKKQKYGFFRKSGLNPPVEGKTHFKRNRCEYRDKILCLRIKNDSLN